MECPGDMVFIDPDGVQRKKSGLGSQLVNVKKKKKKREIMGVVTIAHNICGVRSEVSQAWKNSYIKEMNRNGD